MFLDASSPNRKRKLAPLISPFGDALPPPQTKRPCLVPCLPGDANDDDKIVLKPPTTDLTVTDRERKLTIIINDLLRQVKIKNQTMQEQQTQIKELVEEKQSAFEIAQKLAAERPRLIKQLHVTRRENQELQQELDEQKKEAHYNFDDDDANWLLSTLDVPPPSRTNNTPSEPELVEDDEPTDNEPSTGELIEFAIETDTCDIITLDAAIENSSCAEEPDLIFEAVDHTFDADDLLLMFS